jgi:serine protease Do
MSGCPVLDTEGRLIGIHGMGDKEDANQLVESGLSQEAAAGLAAKIKPGFNYAVPIGTFLQKSSSVGLNTSGLQVEKSKPSELGTPYVASTTTDPRDRIDNIQTTLKSVRQVTDTVKDINNSVQDVRETFGGFGRMFGR